VYSLFCRNKHGNTLKWAKREERMREITNAILAHEQSKGKEKEAQSTYIKTG
jgi:hypothetical protein